MRNGRTDTTVGLLRDSLSIQKSDAEKVIAIIASGEYGDAKTLFQDAMSGKLK